MSHTQLQAVIVSISFKTVLTQEIDNWQSDQTIFKQESPSVYSKIMVCKKVVHSLSLSPPWLISIPPTSGQIIHPSQLVL